VVVLIPLLVCYLIGIAAEEYRRRRAVAVVLGLRMEYYDATSHQWRCSPSLAELLSVLEPEGPPRNARTTTGAAQRRRR